MKKYILTFMLTLLSTMCISAQDAYWHRRVSLFDRLPVTENDIIFLGNSITDGGEFSEIFGNPNIKNRGITSDIITGVEKRLTQVTKGKPAKIFLLIGINDISHNLTVTQLAEMYERLVREIRRQTPGTELYIQSVMPIDNSYRRYKNLTDKENVIVQLNRKLPEIASRNGATYIDLWPALADNDGSLKKEFTNDGLHLTGAAYMAWADVLKPYIAEQPR